MRRNSILSAILAFISWFSAPYATVKANVVQEVTGITEAESSNSIVESTNNAEGAEKAVEPKSEIIGSNVQRRELKELFFAATNREKFKEVGMDVPKVILLEGHSGTGKTTLMNELAKQAEIRIFSVDATEVENENNIDFKIQNIIKKSQKKPSVLHIENAHTINCRNEKLIHKMEVIKGATKKYDITFILETNTPIEDKNGKLKTLIDKTITFYPPNINEIVEIMKKYSLPQLFVCSEINYRECAWHLRNLSGGEIKELMNKVFITGILKNQTKITSKDIIETFIYTTYMATPNPTVERTEEEKRSIACHEAGHALLYKCFLGKMPSIITIQPNAQALGFNLYSGEGWKGMWLMSKDEIDSRIQICMAGKAATDVYFGKPGVSGISDDLQQAYFYAGLAYDCFLTENPLAKRENEEKKLIIECMNKAKKYLREHIDELKRLTDELLEKETLYFLDDTQGNTVVSQNS
ncbi:MAG: AAA family ATPase [Oscillospiraceae bacterium]|nr:AAA family ATPase [Oscillospiraceae bacterium]